MGVLNLVYLAIGLLALHLRPTHLGARDISKEIVFVLFVWPAQMIAWGCDAVLTWRSVHWVKAIELVAVLTAVTAFFIEYQIDRPRDRAVGVATLFAQIAQVHALENERGLQALTPTVEVLAADGVYMGGVNLSGVIMPRAQLSGANFAYVNLEGADLRWANLEGADLSYANLKKANLAGAKLKGATFEGANLTGADFLGGRLERFERQPDGDSIQIVITRFPTKDFTHHQIATACIDPNGVPPKLGGNLKWIGKTCSGKLW